METIKSWRTLATQAHVSTSVSSTVDRDVELSTPLLAPMISENLPSLDAASSIAIGSVCSVVSNSSAGQVRTIPHLLPEWNKPMVSKDVCSLGTPPHSNCITTVSSHDSSSLQLSSGGFLFGLSASLSKPFKFDVSSSSLGAIPLCVGSTSVERIPPLTTSAKIDGTSSGGVPAKIISTSSQDETAIASSSNVQFVRALPLHSVDLPSDADATPLLQIPPQVAKTSNFYSASVCNTSRAVSTSQHDFLSKSDGKQLSLGSILTWTPQSHVDTTQMNASATAGPTQILLPHTQGQSTTNIFHPVLLSSSSSSSSSSSNVDPAKPLYHDLVTFSPKVLSEVVTDDTSSCDCEISPHFEPLVSLPLIDELNSGEEDEKVLFCHRAKLYRFDNCQWKERGVGNMKILKHQISSKVRLLMRRDQILKLCCNHFISGNMSITEMNGSSELAWCTNCDFSDGIPKPETFAIKFKHPETGTVFKQIFEDCALSICMSDSTSEDLSIPGPAISINQTSTSQATLSQKEPSFLDSSSVTSGAEYGSTKPISEDSPRPTDQSVGGQGEVILVKVEMPSDDKIKLSRRLMLPDTFFNYENKPSCPGCRGCIDQIGRIDRKCSVSQDQERELNCHSYDQSTSINVFGRTSKFSVAELATSESSVGPLSQLHYSSPLRAFKGAGEALFEKDVKGVDDLEADGVQFKALVSLPEVNVKTGEESEEVLFTNKAKLFRFDTTVSQWKERGIGDIKLLKNVHTNKVRILMRRDQIFKVCCNHFITSDMSLLAYQERSWMWFTLNDFADEVPRPEKFAVKFKSAEIAQMFRLTFEGCVSRCKSDISRRNVGTILKVDTDTSGINVKEQFAAEHGSWMCSICSVCNPKSVTLCLACQSPKAGLKKLLSPQTSAAILKDLHICSPTEMHVDDTGGFQLPLNITLPTGSTTSISVTKSMITTVSLSPRLTSPNLHVLGSVMSVSEREEMTFSARGILYMEDLFTKQWDKGSHGVMNIMKNKSSREKRLLMISEDRKSVLCSHGITSIMHLKPHAEKERAWTWNGFDNSRSTPTKSAVQKYSVEFLLEDDALRFKNSFETSISVSIDGRQPPYNANDEVDSEYCNELSVGMTLADNQLEILSESDDDVIFICEESPGPSLIKKAEELLLPKSFYLYEKKPPCSGCRGCDNVVESKQTTFTEPERVSNFKDEISTTVGFSSAGLLSFTDLISKEDSSVSSFPEGNRFQFDGAGRQLFSPNLKGDYGPECEAEADIDFAPLVSLPETYLMKSWDEDAVILFLQRAKLYRFDGSIKQWKERGVGDMKILQHPETKKVRLIMRRDQILKLCCNHYLAENMQLMQLETERLWMWFTPSDFSDDKPQPEQFAIRFKCAERGIEFKRVFDECVAQLRSTAGKICLKPLTVKGIPLNDPYVDSWECPQCLIRNKNELCKCAACGCINSGGSNTFSIGSTGGVSNSSLMSTPTVSSIEPYPLSTGSAVGGIKIPKLQEVHLSTSTSLIPVRTSLPSDSMTPIIAPAISHLHTTPTLFQSLADKDHSST
jgi:hypothetical protein